MRIRRTGFLTIELYDFSKGVAAALLLVSVVSWLLLIVLIAVHWGEVIRSPDAIVGLVVLILVALR